MYSSHLKYQQVYIISPVVTAHGINTILFSTLQCDSDQSLRLRIYLVNFLRFFKRQNKEGNKILAYPASSMDERNVGSHRKMVLISNKLLYELLDAPGTPCLSYQQILN